MEYIIKMTDQLRRGAGVTETRYNQNTNTINASSCSPPQERVNLNDPYEYQSRTLNFIGNQKMQQTDYRNETVNLGNYNYNMTTLNSQVKYNTKSTSPREIYNVIQRDHNEIFFSQTRQKGFLNISETKTYNVNSGSSLNTTVIDSVYQKKNNFSQISQYVLPSKGKKSKSASGNQVRSGTINSTNYFAENQKLNKTRKIYLAFGILLQRKNSINEVLQITRGMRNEKGGVVDFLYKSVEAKRGVIERKITKAHNAISFNTRRYIEAAIVIQRWWRRVLTLYRQIEIKIIFIQSFYRGYLVRKRITSFLNPTLLTNIKTLKKSGVDTEESKETPPNEEYVIVEESEKKRKGFRSARRGNDTDIGINLLKNYLKSKLTQIVNEFIIKLKLKCKEKAKLESIVLGKEFSEIEYAFNFWKKTTKKIYEKERYHQRFTVVDGERFDIENHRSRSLKISKKQNIFSVLTQQRSPIVFKIKRKENDISIIQTSEKSKRKSAREDRSFSTDLQVSRKECDVKLKGIPGVGRNGGEIKSEELKSQEEVSQLPQNVKQKYKLEKGLSSITLTKKDHINKEKNEIETDISHAERIKDVKKNERFKSSHEHSQKEKQENKFEPGLSSVTLTKKDHINKEKNEIETDISHIERTKEVKKNERFKSSREQSQNEKQENKFEPGLSSVTLTKKDHINKEKNEIQTDTAHVKREKEKGKGKENINKEKNELLTDISHAERIKEVRKPEELQIQELSKLSREQVEKEQGKGKGNINKEKNEIETDISHAERIKEVRKPEELQIQELSKLSREQVEKEQGKGNISKEKNEIQKDISHAKREKVKIEAQKNKFETGLSSVTLTKKEHANTVNKEKNEIQKDTAHVKREKIEKEKQENKFETGLSSVTLTKKDHANTVNKEKNELLTNVCHAERKKEIRKPEELQIQELSKLSREQVEKEQGNVNKEKNELLTDISHAERIKEIKKPEELQIQELSTLSREQVERENINKEKNEIQTDTAHVKREKEIRKPEELQIQELSKLSREQVEKEKGNISKEKNEIQTDNAHVKREKIEKEKQENKFETGLSSVTLTKKDHANTVNKEKNELLTEISHVERKKEIKKPEELQIQELSALSREQVERENINKEKNELLTDISHADREKLEKEKQENKFEPNLSSVTLTKKDHVNTVSKEKNEVHTEISHAERKKEIKKPEELQIQELSALSREQVERENINKEKNELLTDISHADREKLEKEKQENKFEPSLSSVTLTKKDHVNTVSKEKNEVHTDISHAERKKEIKKPEELQIQELSALSREQAEKEKQENKFEPSLSSVTLTKKEHVNTVNKDKNELLTDICHAERTKEIKKPEENSIQTTISANSRVKKEPERTKLQYQPDLAKFQMEKTKKEKPEENSYQASISTNSRTKKEPERTELQYQPDLAKFQMEKTKKEKPEENSYQASISTNSRTKKEPERTELQYQPDLAKFQMEKTKKEKPEENSYQASISTNSRTKKELEKTELQYQPDLSKSERYKEMLSHPEFQIQNEVCTVERNCAEKLKPELSMQTTINGIQRDKKVKKPEEFTLQTDVNTVDRCKPEKIVMKLDYQENPGKNNNKILKSSRRVLSRKKPKEIKDYFTPLRLMLGARNRDTNRKALKRCFDKLKKKGSNEAEVQTENKKKLFNNLHLKAFEQGVTMKPKAEAFKAIAEYQNVPKRTKLRSSLLNRRVKKLDMQKPLILGVYFAKWRKKAGRRALNMFRMNLLRFPFDKIKEEAKRRQLIKFFYHVNNLQTPYLKRALRRIKKYNEAKYEHMIISAKIIQSFYRYYINNIRILEVEEEEKIRNTKIIIEEEHYASSFSTDVQVENSHADHSKNAIENEEEKILNEQDLNGPELVQVSLESGILVSDKKKEEEGLSSEKNLSNQKDS